MSQGPVLIIDEKGVYPENLDQAIKEQNQMDTSKMVFVFGSNRGGIHGGGAARYAWKNKGAVLYEPYGHHGQSFAIPTKAGSKKDGIRGTLPIKSIQRYVEGFLGYAADNPEISFQVTCIGCGLAGLRNEDVAPLFRNASANCFFDTQWKNILGDGFSYWGSV